MKESSRKERKRNTHTHRERKEHREGKKDRADSFYRTRGFSTKLSSDSSLCILHSFLRSVSEISSAMIVLQASAYPVTRIAVKHHRQSMYAVNLSA